MNHAHDHSHSHDHGHPVHHEQGHGLMFDRRLLLRLALMGLAMLMIGVAGLMLISALGGAAPVAPKSPFGTGLREGGGDGSGLSAIILTLQGLFSVHIMSGLKEIAHSDEALWSVLGVSFIYGVVHAAGPGHGKAVIAAYMLASRSALKRGVGMALAAALLQALVAIGLVGLFSLALNATAASLSSMAGQIERISFIAVASLGLWLLWKKSGQLVATLSPLAHDSHHHHEHDHDHHHHHHDHHHHDEHCGCGHSHAPMVADQAPVKDMITAVLAAGIRPCSGAIVVLVFAISQQLFAVGVAAALVMALGTASTTALLACLAVLARHTASRISGGADTLTGQRVLTGMEVLAAALVAWLGLAFVMAGL